MVIASRSHTESTNKADDKTTTRQYEIEKTARSCLYPLVVNMTDIIGHYLVKYRDKLSDESVRNVVKKAKEMNSFVDDKTFRGADYSALILVVQENTYNLLS